MREFGQDYVRGLGMATHNNALAYGYSVTVASTFGLLTSTAGSPDVGHIFASSSEPALRSPGSTRS